VKLVSIEPTPSPNSMKLNLDETLPRGVKFTYTKENADRAPDIIRRLLAVEGVRSVFHTADFMAVDRQPKSDWQPILAQVREIFGEGGAAPTAGGTEESGTSAVRETANEPDYGEVRVMVQMFRGIPIQVRVNNGREERRAALPERFGEAVLKATVSNPFLIKERKLHDYGVRYGELDDILDEVVREIDAAYDEERLDSLVTQALAAAPGEAQEAASEGVKRLTMEEIARRLDDPDWKTRYAALERLEPSRDTLPLLVKALRDENTSIRRLATVYLGDVKHPDALPHLFAALQDEAASVRRTAGDTLSDLGDPAAIGPMIKALGDRNKLVRWRAARFLYEFGDESALEALRAAQDDPEFEVRLQVRMAIERIESGHEAAGSVWQQMTRRNS